MYESDLRAVKGRKDGRGIVEMSLSVPVGGRVAGKRNRLKKGGYC